jgi:hypothetical protein
MRELEMATLKDVGSEILQSRLAGGDRLGVDIPVDKPGLGWDLREPPGFEKANAAVADAHGLGGPVVDVFALEEILLGFGFRNQIGGFVIEVTEHTDRAGVGFLGRFSFPIELQSSDHRLIPIIDKTSPSVKS